MNILRYLKWWFWTTKRCKHEPGEWRMRDWGMGKIKHCTKCGKCIDLI